MAPSVIGLIILGLCIVLFITNWIPSTATAVLGCGLMVLTGTVSFERAFSGFSNGTVILVFCMLAIGMAMQNSGLAYSIGKLIMRFADSERKFVTAGIILSALLSMFLANMAVIAFFFAIINSVAQSSDHMRLKGICLPICMGAMFGGVCTLIGSTPQMMVQSVMEEYAGFGYKIFDYMPVGLCLLAIFLLYYHLIGYPLSQKLWGNENNVMEEEKLQQIALKGQISEGTVKNQIIVGVITALMLVMFLTEDLTGISNEMTSLIILFLLIFTRQLKEREVLQKMDWPVLIRLAGCLGIAAGLADCESGQLIANGFISIFGEMMSPRILLAATVILTMIISNFISNSTAVFIVLPSVITIALQLGYSALPYGIACCYAANLCFATPLANAQTGVTMAAGYQFSDYIKYNGLLEVLVAAGIIILVPVFFGI